MNQTTRHGTFRAWPKNWERLQIAKTLGINISELINEVLDKHLKTEMENKADKIRKALNVKIS